MPDATELALRALRHRDRSRHDLDERLERAGVSAEEREEALDSLAASGALSDERFAQERARNLAARNAGDALIRFHLRRHGIADEAVDEALARLQPEHERAADIFRRRGGGDRAYRYLAGKGFARETLESLAAGDPLD
jgi:SOS response regulatory protein OraA/RecX